MKILVTGANGQLGKELRFIDGNSGEHQFVFTDLPELDLTHEKSVKDFVRTIKPDLLINCAAYTAVDKAETDMEAAYLMNRDSVRYIARACELTKTFLFHISTDYVFDGKSHRPYTEYDSASPISVYGTSKFQGEQEVVYHTKRALIVRTSWLYSAYGNNFVRTMLRLGKDKGEVQVVSDQVGCPTYARGMAEALVKMAPLYEQFREVDVFHYVNSGVASWYDFALAVFELSGVSCKVNPILTKDFPTSAKRPFYSVLNNEKISKAFNIEIPHWRISLKECLQEIAAAPDLKGSK